MKINSYNALRGASTEGKRLVRRLLFFTVRSKPELNTDNWCEQFPRLSDLKRSTESADQGYCFQSLPSVLRNPLAEEYFRGIENDLSALDHESWQTFLTELQCRIPTKVGKQSRCALASLLNEAKGYAFLKNQGLNDVFFIPRSPKAKQATPDVGAISEGELNAMVEVKSVWPSDYETNWIEENTVGIEKGSLPTVRRLVPSFPEGLKNKLKTDLQKASSQLRAYPAPQSCRRVIYFVIYLDYEQQNTPGITRQIESYLKGLISNDGSEVHCDFQNAFE